VRVMEEKNWPTPTSGRADQQLSPSQLKRNSLNLAMTVEKEANWPTPRAVDYKGAGAKEGMTRKDGKSRLDQLPNAVVHGLPAQDSPNTTGKSRGQLNPAWVEQLMGLPQGWTDLDSSETE